MRHRLSPKAASTSTGGKPEGGLRLQVKTRVKAGSTDRNHNETLVRGQKPTQGLKVKGHIKAGATGKEGSMAKGDDALA